MKDTEGTEMGNIYISSEQIIQEVQKFRCLYDPADPDHKDRDIMRDAWLSVTQAVVGEPWANLNSAEKNEAEKDLKKKWKDMRDSFVRSLKRECERSRNGDLAVRNRRLPYSLNKDMSFLLQTEHYKEYASAVMDVPPTKPPSAVETVGAVRSSKLTTHQKDRTFGREDSSTSSYSSFPAPHHNPEPENPDRMFLLSLLPRVSALNSADKMDFQIGILQLLQGYETEDSCS